MKQPDSAGVSSAPRLSAGRPTLTIWHEKMQQIPLRDLGPTLVLLALIAVFALTTRQFVSVGNTVAIVESSAIPIILVVAMTFIIVQGSIDLSIEGVMGSSAMVTALLIASTATNNNFGWWAIVAALTYGLLFGIINGLIYVFVRLPSLIVTLGTWFVGLGIANLLFPGRQPQILDTRLTSLAINKYAGVSTIVIIALVTVLLGWLVQRYTQFGRMSYAIGADEKTTRQSGLPVGFHKILAYAFMGILASLCGVLISAQLSVGSPVAGAGLLFPTISAAVIGGTLLSGGRGGVIQSVIGVLILEVLRNGMLQLGVDTYLRHVVEGATIITALALGNWRLRSRVRVVK